MRCSGILLQVKDECPDMVFVDPFYTGRVVISLEKLMEPVKKTGIPLDGLWTLVLSLAGKFKSLYQILQV